MRRHSSLDSSASETYLLELNIVFLREVTSSIGNSLLVWRK